MRDDEPIQRRTILCVDDDEEILQALRHLLLRDGHDVLVATCGQQGLELLAQHDVALIISNQTMPGMAGTRFLEESREVAPNAVRIMLSGDTDLNTAVQAINEGGIHRYLTKPWDDDQLRMTVNEHLRTYTAQRRARDLLDQLQEKNELLERFNADLELLVVERSKDLFYRVRELEARDRLARFMMTVHSLPETLDYVAAVVGEALDAQRVEVHMVEKDQEGAPRACWPAHAVPMEAEQVHSLVTEAATGDGPVCQHRDNIFWCATPIVRDNEKLAVVLLNARGTAEHAEESAKILSGVALAAAIVIYEAKQGYDVGGWRDALDEALSRVDDLVD